MMTSTGQHRQVKTVAAMHERLRRRFLSPEKQDELVYQWTTLRQTGTLEEYRERFFLLQTNLPLGEKAEYLLASVTRGPTGATVSCGGERASGFIRGTGAREDEA